MLINFAVFLFCPFHLQGCSQGVRDGQRKTIFFPFQHVGTSKLDASNWGPHTYLVIDREKRCWIWSGLLKAKEKQDQNEVVPRDNLEVTNDIWGKVGKIRLSGVERSRGKSHHTPKTGKLHCESPRAHVRKQLFWAWLESVALSAFTETSEWLSQDVSYSYHCFPETESQSTECWESRPPDCTENEIYSIQ